MRIPVTNNTAMPIYVGSAMIPAGETREFEENDVPLHLRPAQAPAEPVKPALSPEEQAEADAAAAKAKREAEIAVIRAKSVKDAREHFSELSDEDLATLEALEQAEDEPRKTLLEAITEEQLQRAAAAGVGQG